MNKKAYFNKLTPEQYDVCFLKGTEPPGSGKYDKHFKKGVYKCVVCDNELFSSATKYDSGTGWPAFWDMADPKAIMKSQDLSGGTIRKEVTCAKCGSHLGHVFNDGQKEKTGLRYCINSLSLRFTPL